MELRNATEMQLYTESINGRFERARDFIAARREIESPARIAQAMLRRSPYLALRKIICVSRGQVLILRGRLPTFHTRQVMHALLRSIDGVQRIDDETEVDAAPARRLRQA